MRFFCPCWWSSWSQINHSGREHWLLKFFILLQYSQPYSGNVLTGASILVYQFFVVIYWYSYKMHGGLHWIQSLAIKLHVYNIVLYCSYVAFFKKTLYWLLHSIFGWYQQIAGYHDRILVAESAMMDWHPIWRVHVVALLMNRKLTTDLRCPKRFLHVVG